MLRVEDDVAFKAIVNPPANETLLSVLLKVTIVAPALELLCLFI